MRLTEGHIRIWLLDIERFFKHSPREYAMFSYLLANVHYKDDPYPILIKGNTYKKEFYSKEWNIEKGDYCGSKAQIKEFWKFDNRTQKKLFDNIAEIGLIDVLLEDPALIIRIKNYAYFSWRGKNKDRPPFIREKKEEPKKEEELHTPTVELHTPTVELHTPLCNPTYPPM